MSTISHKDMNRVRETKTETNRPRPQTYVVDDATNPEVPQVPASPSIDDELAQFVSQGNRPVETGVETKLPPRKPKIPITKALEKLIFIGRLAETVEFGGSKFEVSTLTNKEHGEIIHMMYSFTDPADLFMIRLITLANALKTIDGISLDDIEIEGDFESDLHKRMSIIDHLQLSVLEKLYDVYEKLTDESEATSDEAEEIKN